MNLQKRRARIKKFKKDRSLLKRARAELRQLRERVNLNPAQSDEIESQEAELTQDIRLVNSAIDAILDGRTSIKPPSDSQFKDMKKAVKELEEINKKDRRTKKAIAAATKIATEIGNIN